LIPLSQSPDVVAHELTHGVTDRTSGLVYQDESGALNEAISDMFGAAIHYQVGASQNDVWLIGKDIYTPSISGDALRNMADPAEYKDTDWWPTRNMGTYDNGYVHSNSGIANLAFSLMVTGGTHPRGKSSVVVPAINSDFGTSLLEAARIFYNSNTACLTPGSNFAAARYCTADVMGGAYAANIHAAWDAVGVPNIPPAPPITLTNGTPLTDQYGDTGEVRQYILNDVTAGSTVTCSLAASTGDADLYVRFGWAAIPDHTSALNDCASYGSDSNEQCTTSSAASSTSAFLAVYAYNGYSGMTILCTSGISSRSLRSST
jgi:bacillolysin